MRKCAQCGNDIPAGQSSCGNCGYNPDHIQKTYAFGSSTKNQGNNSNKAGKIILIIFLLIFFSPFIVGIFFFILAFFIFSPSMFEDLDPDDYEELNVCETYCGDDYIEILDDCHCGNGSVYDNDGNFLYNSNYPNEENINLSPGEVSKWKQDVLSDKKVVTILCDDNSYGCSDMRTMFYNSARENGYIMYYFQTQILSSDEVNTFRDIVNIDLYFDVHPFTFVTENGNVLGQKNGFLYNDELDEWLQTLDVVR